MHATSQIRPGLKMSPEEYEQLILSEPDEVWELVCGRLREKPAMSMQHGDAAGELFFHLRGQLDPRIYRVSVNHARLQRVDGSYFVPDIVVMRVADLVGDRSSPGTVDALGAPALLVVEVWS